LRSLDGFSQALLEDFADRLDEAGRDYLRRIRAAAQRMALLIDDLLALSRVSRAELRPERVDLTAVAREIARRLGERDAGRRVTVSVDPELVAEGDPRLLAIALENLLENAWKYTRRKAEATIRVGAERRDGQTVFCVRDNGAGFDMAHAGKLFSPFQRLHRAEEFEGTGVGLATVQRILRRHGGRAWAEGEVGRGAAFYFTLGEPRESGNPP
jgi:signal transduction histidine kinase